MPSGAYHQLFQFEKSFRMANSDLPAIMQLTSRMMPSAAAVSISGRQFNSEISVSDNQLRAVSASAAPSELQPSSVSTSQASAMARDVALRG